MSFAEVEFYIELEKKMAPSNQQNRHQTTLEYHADVDPVAKQAKGKLKRATPNTTRSTRRADTKLARKESLKKERHELVSAPLSIEPEVVSSAVTSGNHAPDAPKVNGLRLVQSESTGQRSDTLLPAERAQELFKRMIDGD
jgi:hypothetical protein